MAHSGGRWGALRSFLVVDFALLSQWWTRLHNANWWCRGQVDDTVWCWYVYYYCQKKKWIQHHTFHGGPPPEYWWWLNRAWLRSSDGIRYIPCDMVVSISHWWCLIYTILRHIVCMQNKLICVNTGKWWCMIIKFSMCISPHMWCDLWPTLSAHALTHAKRIAYEALWVHACAHVHVQLIRKNTYIMYACIENPTGHKQ